MKNERGLMGMRDADGNFVTGPKAGEFPLKEEQYNAPDEMNQDDAFAELLKEAPEEIRKILETFDNDLLEDLRMYLDKKMTLEANKSNAED